LFFLKKIEAPLSGKSGEKSLNLPKILLMKGIRNLLIILTVFSLTTLACKKEEKGDGIKPIIVVKGFNPQYWALGQPYVDSGASAYDISATGDTVDITASIVTKMDVNVDMAGDYKVTYNVTDISGLAADQQERTVKVVSGK